jgi:hypothetical protein
MPVELLRQDLASALESWAARASPVFVVGVPRTGTSLTATIIGRHSAFIDLRETIHETFAFAKPARLAAAQLEGSLRNYLGPLEDRFRAAASLVRAPAEVGTRDVIRAFFWCSWIAHDFRRLYEKTPAHVYHLEALFEAFPRAKVIVCTRDPIQTFTSYRKRLKREVARGKSPDDDDLKWLTIPVGQFIKQVVRARKSTAQALERWPEAVLRSPYDALVERPEASARRLFKFIGEPFDPASLRPSGRGKGPYAGEIRRDPGDPADYLSVEELAALRERFSPKA